MKTLFLILLSVSVYGQSQNLSIDNGRVVYEKVFEREGKSKEVVFEELTKWMTVNDIFSHERIVDSVIYASTRMYNVQIDFKDEKYRVRANNIKIVSSTQAPMDLEDIVLRKRNTEWRKGSSYQEIAKMADEVITKHFTLQEKSKGDW